MILRTARRGPNAGNQFWGCSSYPQCKWTLNADLPANENPQSEPIKETSQAEENIFRKTQRPVEWVERNYRADWSTEYIKIGAFPTSLDPRGILLDEAMRRVLSQTLFLFNRNLSGSPASGENQLLASLLTKILQRGSCPLPTLNFENHLIEEYDLSEHLVNLDDSGLEVGWKWLKPAIKRSTILARFCERDDFVLDEEFEEVFDSPIEKEFFSGWLMRELPDALPWISPQASLDTLLEGVQSEEAGFGARRVDFLFSHPFGKPVVIELDGEEHQAALSVDRERDAALRKLGVDVIRVPNIEVEQGAGPQLDKVCRTLAGVFEKLAQAPLDDISKYVFDCCFGSKLQMALVKAIEKSALAKAPRWDLTISGLNSKYVNAVLDLVLIADSFENIYGFDVLPDEVIVSFDDETLRIAKENESWEISSAEPALESLSISVECDLSPYHKIDRENSGDRPDIIVRPTFLPIHLSAGKPYTQGRIYLQEQSLDVLDAALKVLLRQIFRKAAFREGQVESIRNALTGVDTIVLLPTGAGKSIIYQLSGLILPGMTFVVDPLKSLIEDQVEGLAKYGIDRVLGIVSGLVTPAENTQLLHCAEKGEYLFVLMSPERLQTPQFRETLKSIAQSSLVNLAVIDEAHCVSEWGHDFRPSYLNLGRNLRDFCKDFDGAPPPLLGLTGTASRAVLRDLLADLQIDSSRTEALIRPASFNRKELNFEIRKIRPGDALSTLKGILNALPGKFNVPATEFFAPQGEHTYSGIVFNRYVNGWQKGIVDLRDIVRSAARTSVSIFSGSQPKTLKLSSKEWEHEKRLQAASFKNNETPILVSTKAFGMGIDKANVRYTLHNGMPGSLEAFYQEAGRAGRNRKDAYCYVVFTENDESTAQSLVDSTATLVELRQRVDAIDRHESDDTRDVLWFHLNSFAGVEEELLDVRSTIEKIGDFSRTRKIDIPNRYNGKGHERAVYRLVQCGVLRDYEVDFGGQKFILHVNSFNREKCINTILEYVRRSQPGRVESLHSQLAAVVGENNKEELLGFCRVLLEFSYDVIERSRRRAIQEAMETARRAQGDEDFRRRLLEYLQEGVGHEVIEGLIDEPVFTFDSWLAILANIHNPIEAGELRGIVIRFLESYPSQPGLLVLRAISESLCADMDETSCYENLVNAFGPGADQYSLDEDEIKEGLDSIVEIAKERSKKLLPSLAYALTRLNNEGHVENYYYEKVKSNLVEIGGDDVQLVFIPELAEALVPSLNNVANELNAMTAS